MRVARLTAAIAALAAAAALGACGADDESAGTSTATGGGKQLQKIRYLHPGPSPLTVYQYPAYVGEQLGYFADEGLTVESTFLGESLPVPVYVQNGEAEVAGASADQILQGIAQGADYKVYYDAYQRTFDVISAGPGSGVDSIEDLAGKRVGYAESDDLTTLKTALDLAGVDESSVEIVKVGRQGPTVADQLRNGNLAAYAAGYSDTTTLQNLGIDLTDITPEEFATRPSVSMVALPQMVSDDREAIVGFFRAWAKATYAGIVNKKMLQQMSKDANPEEHANPQQSMASVETATDIMTPANGEFGAFRPEGWESSQEELLGAGELKGPVDLEEVLDSSLLEEINDWDRDEVEADTKAWMEAHGA